jgi:TonB family protein
MARSLVVAVALALTLAASAGAQSRGGSPRDAVHGSASPVSRKVLLENVVEGPLPVYPAEAKAAGVFGTVVVDVVVDSSGKVVAALDVDGDERLGAAAASAVERWRFKPMRADDGNATVAGSLAFDFGGTDVVGVLPSRIDEPPVDVETPELYEQIVTAFWPMNPTAGTANEVEGLVHVHITIGPDGDVTRAEVVSGPEPLREAVRSSVGKWIFDSTLVDGEEVFATGDVYLLFEKGLSSGRLAWDNGLPLRSREEPATGPPSPPPPPPSATPHPGVVRLSTGVLAGKATRKVEPVYPTMSEIAVEGRVVVEVTVGEDGKVVAARAVSGHPLLRDAAVEAARQWTFSPTHLSGKPVKVLGTFTFDVRKPASRRR